MLLLTYQKLGKTTKVAIGLAILCLCHSFTRYFIREIYKSTRPSFFTPLSSFDSEFADAFSKPLPDWYKDQVIEKEEEMRDLESNRERIRREFQKKYNVTEETKILEFQQKWSKIEERKRKISSQKKRSTMNVLGIEDTTQMSTSDEDAEDSETTKEKWQKFWEDEEKGTGFNLPGFFEVFPELKLKWPTWAKKKDGKAIKCKVDQDCMFPQACCPHPIIPGDKFCCTGWGQRIMVPAYAGEYLKFRYDLFIYLF